MARLPQEMFADALERIRLDPEQAAMPLDQQARLAAELLLAEAGQPHQPASLSLVTQAQAKKLLNDAERLNFWQAHHWFKGECTQEGLWRFSDGKGRDCEGGNLRDALDQLRAIQPDERDKLIEQDSWDG